MNTIELCLDQAAEIELLNAQVAMLREALSFYADKYHFDMHQPEFWDTVSGEPENFYEDEACTATVEDGSVAEMTLKAVQSDWLASHDKQVRDAALEEAAEIADSYIDCQEIVDEIRSFKGKP